MTLTTEREIRRTRIRSILRWTQRLLLITGALALSYVGFTLLDARLYQASAKRSLEGEIHQAKEHHESQLKPAVKTGDLAGFRRFPRKTRGPGLAASRLCFTQQARSGMRKTLRGRTVAPPLRCWTFLRRYLAISQPASPAQCR